MKTLEQFMVGLTPMQLVRVGAIITAYETRQWFRVNHKLAEARKAQTEKERCGGWLASVGDYYDQLNNEAEQLRQQAASVSISMDKFYKKMKHTFIEVGGTDAQVVELINILAAQPANNA
jgi:hypothetical protein